MAETRSMPRKLAAISALFHVAMIAILAEAGLPWWRIAGVGGLFVTFMVLQRLVIARVRDARCIDSAFLCIAFGAQLFVVGNVVLTGGVHSPFVPNLVLPAIMSLFFFGPIPASRWIAVANFSLIVATVALPTSVVGVGMPDVPYSVALVASLGWSLFMLHQMAGKLAVAATRAGETYACLREERVAEAEAQLHRLQSVGAKVAHELKNPLAAIKGLCQLVSRAPSNERTGERLAVVEAEIARMETILREYLSFSRPLEDLRGTRCPRRHGGPRR
jgi:signal transduction histidine kinase